MPPVQFQTTGEPGGKPPSLAHGLKGPGFTGRTTTKRNDLDTHQIVPRIVLDLHLLKGGVHDQPLKLYHAFGNDATIEQVAIRITPNRCEDRQLLEPIIQGRTPGFPLSD
jgi:hypothetical protein